MRSLTTLLTSAALIVTAQSAKAQRYTDANGHLRVALVMLKMGTSAPEAQRRLKRAGENLRRALGE